MSCQDTAARTGGVEHHFNRTAQKKQERRKIFSAPASFYTATSRGGGKNAGLVDMEGVIQVKVL